MERRHCPTVNRSLLLKSWVANFCSSICTNGPAIWGGCVTRRSIRAGSWYFSREIVTVQGGYGTCFCRHGTNIIELYSCRGTSLIGAVSLSPVTKLVAGTGAVSRYKLSQSQKFITVQDLKRGQMSVSGCNNYYKFVLSAGAKAKTMTNLLILLSVLVQVVLLIFLYAGFVWKAGFPFIFFLISQKCYFESVIYQLLWSTGLILL